MKNIIIKCIILISLAQKITSAEREEYLFFSPLLPTVETEKAYKENLKTFFNRPPIDDHKKRSPQIRPKINFELLQKYDPTLPQDIYDCALNATKKCKGIEYTRLSEIKITITLEEQHAINQVASAVRLAIQDY